MAPDDAVFLADAWEDALEVWSEIDWDDDEPVEAQCDLENPDYCESCQ